MTTDHPIMVAARAACEALTRALDTERRAADEVEARGGERNARDALNADRLSAAGAMVALSKACAKAGCGRALLQDLAERTEAVREGYAREKWTLRIMAIASEAVAEETRT